MKKFTACFLVFSLIVLIFSGCSSQTQGTEVADSTVFESETTSPPVTESVFRNAALELLSTMSLEEKIAQLFIVTPEQLLNSDVVTSFNGDSLPYDVGGIILFDFNIKSPEQTKKLINSFQNASKLPLFICVDEEGGRVSRIGSNPNMRTTVFPDAKHIKTEENAFNSGKTIGSEIKQLGFNLNFAPVADVNSNPENTVIGDRAYGSDPNHVAKQVSQVVKGYKTVGMLCTLKHFPGHGDTVSDSHFKYTETTKTADELRKNEFLPFSSGISAGAEFVMLGHIAAPKITGNNLPATLSPKIVDILRNELNFKGIIITDSMIMKAITNDYSSSTAAVKALQAGVDMILIPKDINEAVSGIKNKVKSGEIGEERINESVLRILEIKYINGIIS